MTSAGPLVLDGGATIEVVAVKGGLGRVTHGRQRLPQNVAKLDEPAPTRTADGHYVVTNAVSRFANRKQSLRLFSGGGGNRTQSAAIR